MRVPTKEEFIAVTSQHSTMEILMQCIPYKKSIQVLALSALNDSELHDVKYSRINMNAIDKLCALASCQSGVLDNTMKLYAVAMSVGTIIKEYEWGDYYVTKDGLYELALKILAK